MVTGVSALKYGNWGGRNERQFPVGIHCTLPNFHLTFIAHSPVSISYSVSHTIQFCRLLLNTKIVRIKNGCIIYIWIDTISVVSFHSVKNATLSANRLKEQKKIHSFIFKTLITFSNYIFARC